MLCSFIQRTNLLAANALLALSRSLSSEAFWLRRSSCVASVKCCKVAWIWSDLFATDGDDSVKAINSSKNPFHKDNKVFGLLQQCTLLPAQGWGTSLMFDWKHKESLQKTVLMLSWFMAFVYYLYGFMIKQYFCVVFKWLKLYVTRYIYRINCYNPW